MLWQYFEWNPNVTIHREINRCTAKELWKAVGIKIELCINTEDSEWTEAKDTPYSQTNTLKPTGLAK